jgi:hypothetical protein
MKPFNAVLVASLVLGACEKSNNVTQLHDETVATAKYYAPRVDALQKRQKEIAERGRGVPGSTPDVPELVRFITDASDKINEMKGITGALERQADDLARTNKADELEKLMDESEEKLDTDYTIANDDLSHLEAWLWRFEQSKGQLPPPPPPPTELPTPSDTGEPPPAAATGSGAGSAAKAPDGEKKADEKKKPAEKAAAKAATEKVDTKTGQPKTEPKAAPKAEPKAEPKAAAPKAAGSAAK